LGVRLRLGREVRKIVSASGVQLTHGPDTAGASAAADEPAQAEDAGGAPQTESFDHVVVCAAVGSVPLLASTGLQLPLIPVYGYSVTAPLRERANAIFDGPKSALLDERYKVAISRLGQRVRVAGCAELGGIAARHNASALATLYKVFDDWFPGCVHREQAQAWKGARPMMPDGPPLLGPSGTTGVWLNLGHGSSGWALACGSARVLADQLGARRPEIDVQGLGIERLR
jgi:D-amino-acid dehydrogenase